MIQLADGGAFLLHGTELVTDPAQIKALGLDQEQTDFP